MPDERGRLLPEDVDFGLAFTPFTDAERARLARYVKRADRLAAANFWKRTTEHRTTLKITRDAPPSLEMTHVEGEGDEDEGLHVMFGRLRHFYQEGNPHAASFPRILKTLRNHASARGGVEGGRMLELLGEIEEWHERVQVEGYGMGLSAETRQTDGSVVAQTVTPRQAFLDWLYGEVLHDDEEKLARVEVFRPHGIHLHTAIAVATSLTHVYLWVSKQIIARVIAEESLFPATTKT